VHRIGDADGFIPFLDAHYASVPPEEPAMDGGCVPTGAWFIYWRCNTCGEGCFIDVPGHQLDHLLCRSLFLLGSSFRQGLETRASVVSFTLSSAPHCSCLPTPRRRSMRFSALGPEPARRLHPGVSLSQSEVVLATTMSPAFFTVPLPPEPLLIGARFCVQGGSLQGNGCVLATDGARVTIQPFVQSSAPRKTSSSMAAAWRSPIRLATRVARWYIESAWRTRSSRLSGAVFRTWV